MSEAIASNPAVADSAIPVRRPDLDLSSEIPRYWCRNEPFATHWLNALSSFFPAGEAFFVRSVMHYSDRFKDDPELSAQVRGFAGQEGRHSYEHDRHLDLLAEQGYTAIASQNRVLDRVLRWSNRRQPVFSLAATAGIEHLTSILARVVMSSDRMVHGMDPRIQALWEWHALEEAEHKTVAYDVLQRVSSSYALRVYILAINTLSLFAETFARAIYMLWKDGELFKRKTWSDGWRFLFGSGSGSGSGREATATHAYQPRGILRGLGPDYWAWYRRDFHPSQRDDSAFIAEYRERFAVAAATGSSSEEPVASGRG